MNFELVVCSACPEQQGQAAPSQKLLLSKAVFSAVLQHSRRKIQEKRCLRDKENEPAIIDKFNLCTENGLVDLFPELKNLGAVSLLLRTRKFVEEMKQEYRKIPGSQRPEAFENAIS